MPSRSGPEGPPSPYGALPRYGPIPARTAGAPALAQDRVMLDGPFPHGGLVRGISDGRLFEATDAGVRASAFARAREAGAGVARIAVDWRKVAPASPPPGFQARDPASRGYDFASVDAAVKGAVAAGLAPLLVVSHAPAFAEAPGRWPYAYPGSWDPDPAALEAFAAALARRYDGTFPDPAAGGGALPRVRLLQAWNEPNLARYLSPQWVASEGRWVAFSPLLYRRLLGGFYAGVKSVAPSDLVASGGLAPNGDREGVGRMAPVPFLRSLLCIVPGHSGRLRRMRGCPQQARFDALAFHPLSVGDPDLPAQSSLNVSIADAGKLTALLNAALRLHTIVPAGPKGLWVTELNWESAPPAADGVPAAAQAAWVSRGLHRLWAAGVGLVAWQFLADPFPALTLATPTGGLTEYPRPAGLYSAGPGGELSGAAPKPFLTGFRLPFDPLRADRRSVRVWALLDAPGAPAELLGRRSGGAWRPLASLRADRSGVLDTPVPLRGRWELQLRSGTVYSAPAVVGARRAFVR